MGLGVVLYLKEMQVLLACFFIMGFMATPAIVFNSYAQRIYNVRRAAAGPLSSCCPAGLPCPALPSCPACPALARRG